MTTVLNALAIHPRLGGDEMVRLSIRREAVARTASPASKLHDDKKQEWNLEDRIQANLNASPYPAVRRVRCKFEGGVRRLYGTVSNYHCVQLAITLVRAHMPESVPVQNHLQVFNTSEA